MLCKLGYCTTTSALQSIDWAEIDLSRFVAVFSITVCDAPLHGFAERAILRRPGTLAKYLLLGEPQDVLCQRVRHALEARHCPTHLIANSLVDPSRIAWRLDNEQSVSWLAWRDEPPVPDGEIAGVLVRSAGWIDPSGWQPDDLAYIQTEAQAALLAWLWSLDCPVVNRYSPWMWNQPRIPFLSWQALLWRAGLPTLEMLVTNVEQEARSFGSRAAGHGLSGAVYGPLTGDVRYLVASEPDWVGLASLQRYAPVCLARPYGTAQMVCVVGEQVVWDGEPAAEIAKLEPALRRFARAVGLAFVELALAPVLEDLCVVAVEARPILEHFGPLAHAQIVEAIVQLLTEPVVDGRAGRGPNGRGLWP